MAYDTKGGKRHPNWEGEEQKKMASKGGQANKARWEKIMKSREELRELGFQGSKFADQNTQSSILDRIAEGAMQGDPKMIDAAIKLGYISPPQQKQIEITEPDMTADDARSIVEQKLAAAKEKVKKDG